MSNDALQFEWDSKKAERNLRKHGVSFAEAATIFDDVLAAVYDDPDHSEQEKRYLTIGNVNSGTIAPRRLRRSWSAH